MKLVTVRKYRRLLVIALSAAAVLGLAVGATALVGYNEATKIDRSITTVVVRQYVDELLVRRDDERASLFACSDQSGLAPFLALRDQLKREEEANGVTTQVVPARLVEASETTVEADLKLNQGNGLHLDRRSQTWLFTLKNEDGWRVCSAVQLPDPSPTPTPPTAG